MAHDELLSSTDKEERLSDVYLRAVAAKAGYAVAIPDLDRDGIDVEIKAGGAMRPTLGIQLKATINLGAPDGGFFRYSLAVRNYELLRLTTQTPRILVVLALPQAEEEWLAVSPEALTLKRCAYWVSLLGEPETTNKATITVSIPDSQIFDPVTLTMLMDKSRSGTKI